MAGTKFRFLIAVITVFILTFGLVGQALAAAQPPEMVDVLIGFGRQPGPNEEAVVRGAGGTIKYTYHLIPVIAATVPEVAIRGLEANPNVTYVEEDGIVYAIEETLPWGVDRIDAEVVHAAGNKGAGIKVAILDTGIDLDHPDLNIVQSVKFAPGRDADDRYGHGTHVAGIVAALDNDYGVIGVAPEAWLYNVKVLGDQGQGRLSNIVKGIEWSVDNGMQVMNMSYGGGYSRSEDTALQAAYDAGIVLVSSAGNSGDTDPDDDVGYPAKYDSVIAVAATDNTDTRASWSSDGPAVELAAPGVSIPSTYKGGGYASLSGTSMASPHVAGIAALILDENPTWTPAQVRAQLQATAKDLGATGKDNLFGYGLVDAENAVLGTTSGNNFAIDTGSIGGTVTDGTAAIANATVVVEGTTLSDTTAADGTYTIADVPVGTYTVTASAGGYQSQSVNNVTVTKDATTTVNFALSQAVEPTGTMHVAAILMWYDTSGPNFFIYTKVTIVDADGAPVPEAIVYLEMTLPNSSTPSGSGMTNADGTVTFKLRSKQTGTYTSTVTNVVKDSWTYDSEANEETSDSIPAP